MLSVYATNLGMTVRKTTPWKPQSSPVQLPFRMSLQDFERRLPTSEPPPTHTGILRNLGACHIPAAQTSRNHN